MNFRISPIFFLAFVSEVRPNCHAGLDGPARNSATKTPYAFVAPAFRDVDPEKESPAGCRPEQLWLISRHGTRYPSPAAIRLIRERLPKMIQKIEENNSGSLCSDMVRELSGSFPEVPTFDLKKRLHPEGESEMILLGERMQKRFPGILNGDYHPELFKFRATFTQRANMSQLSFATGLFGRKTANSINYELPVEPHDPLIRPYKVCPKWQKEVKQNPDSLREKTLFENSDMFLNRVIRPVSERLGYKENLSLEDLDALYNGCVFGQAWRPDSVFPWCKVFTEEELELLEYREDLEYYWQDGYGFEITGKIGCGLMKDVLENFENVTVNRKTEENGIFYFTHSGTILKLLTHLGLFRDSEQLRHDNFDKMRNSRLWKTSLIDTFGSNIGFVLQKCDNDDFKVGLLVNEKLTQIPGCQMWCPFDIFKKLFNNDDCDLNKLCHVDDQDLDFMSNLSDDKF